MTRLLVFSVRWWRLSNIHHYRSHYRYCFVTCFFHSKGIFPMLLYSLLNCGCCSSLSRVWLCNPMDCSTHSYVLHHLPGFTRIHVHWVGDPIQSSHPLPPPSSFCLQSFQASRSFPMSWLFISGGQSIGASSFSIFFPVNIQGWIPLEWTGWISFDTKELLRVLSSITTWKHQFFGA